MSHNLIMKNVLCLIFSMILMVVIDASLPPKYQLSGVISVGKIKGELIEDPQVTAARIRSDNFLTKLCMQGPENCQIDMIKKNISLLIVGEGFTVVYTSYDKVSTSLLAKRIADLVVERHITIAKDLNAKNYRKTELVESYLDEPKVLKNNKVVIFLISYILCLMVFNKSYLYSLLNNNN